MSKPILSKTSLAAIALTLSWGEDYGFQNDGLFLQPEETISLNNALAASANAAADLATANDTIKDLNEQIKKMEGVQAKSESDTEALNKRIGELEEEVKELGGKSSGTGTKLPVKEDPKLVEAGDKVSLLDPEHPLNKYANAKVAVATRMKAGSKK